MTKTFRRFGMYLKCDTFPAIRGLLFFFCKNGGRNNMKKLVSYSKRGGKQRKHRIIDFKRLIWNLPAKILRFEKDPLRTALISLICYNNGILSYVLALYKTEIGQSTRATSKLFSVKSGYCCYLKYIPEGTLLNSVELFPGIGGTLARSAGVSLLLMRKFAKSVLLRLPSREEIMLKNNCLATMGIVSNINNKFVYFSKAGQKRLLGYRPKVRGVARNPVDHPHGGGGGRCQVTYWAKVAKNKTTRKFGKKLTEIIISRKKVRRRKR